MPQMSPMNWFFLFLFFNLGFYVFMVKSFYFMNKIILSKEINLENKKNVFYFEL